MNIRQIETFRAVMQSLSMTEAAKALHTSQPNVSRSISQLEAHVGFKLFHRNGSGVQATPEGLFFFGETQRLYSGMDRLVAAAELIRKRSIGVLRIGAVPSLAMSIVPQAIRLFRARYSDVEIIVQTNDSQTVATWTALQHCDIGMVSYAIDTAGVKVVASRSDAAIGIVHARHRLADRELLNAHDFDNEAFISLPAGDGTRVVIDQAFSPDRRRILMETPYAATICNMVGLELGSSVVNPLVYQSVSTDQVRALPFEPPIELRSYVLTAGLSIDSELVLHFIYSLRLCGYE